MDKERIEHAQMGPIERPKPSLHAMPPTTLGDHAVSRDWAIVRELQEATGVPADAMEAVFASDGS